MSQGSKKSGKAAALDIFRAALEAANPQRAVLSHVRLLGTKLIVDKQRYDLKTFEQVRVIGAGKAGLAMARAVEELLGTRISEGHVNIPDGPVKRLGRIQLHSAGHPVPDQRGMAGARRIAELARASGPHDLMIALISGGASALMPLPGPGITLARKRQITRQLLARGATIHEMNCVRKHISAIKGGQLAKLAYPATLIALILSDVIGDDLDVIGSGPSVPDATTCADARAVLRKYSIPAPTLTETPKPGDRIFARVQNAIVGSNHFSMEAAAAKARALGYRPIVLSTTIDGETREIARMHAAIAREMIAHQGHRICFLSGGETTVTLRGTGLGGRNQEFVLAALLALEESRGVEVSHVTVFSAGTDGMDGPTDAAGACGTVRVLERARERRLVPTAYLARNDSYHFFEQLRSLIRTGPTGTNVMDVRLLLID